MSAAYNSAELASLKQHSIAVQNMIEDCPEGDDQLISLIKNKKGFGDSVRLLIPILREAKENSDAIDDEQELQQSTRTFLQKEKESKKRAKLAAVIMKAANFHAVESVIEECAKTLATFFTSEQQLTWLREDPQEIKECIDVLQLPPEMEVRVSVEIFEQMPAVKKYIKKRIFERGLHKVLGSHSWAARSVSLSLDGDKVLSGGDDGKVMVWSLSDGTKKEIGSHQHHVYRRFGSFLAHGVNSVDWSPEGDQVVSGGHDGKVMLWSVKDGSKKEIGSHANLVNFVSWSPKGDKIVSWGRDNKVIVWPVNNCSQKEICWQIHSLKAVCWHAEGDRIIAKKTTGQMIEWSLDDENSAPVNSKADPISLASWKHENGQIVFGECAGKVIAWNPKDHNKKELGVHVGRVHAASWACEGDRVVFTTDSGKVIVWFLPLDYNKCVQGLSILDTLYLVHAALRKSAKHNKFQYSMSRFKDIEPYIHPSISQRVACLEQKESL